MRAGDLSDMTGGQVPEAMQRESHLITLIKPHSARFRTYNSTQPL